MTHISFSSVRYGTLFLVAALVAATLFAGSVLGRGHASLLSAQLSGKPGTTNDLLQKLQTWSEITQTYLDKTSPALSYVQKKKLGLPLETDRPYRAMLEDIGKLKSAYEATPSLPGSGNFWGTLERMGTFATMYQAYAPEGGGAELDKILKEILGFWIAFKNAPENPAYVLTSESEMKDRIEMLLEKGKFAPAEQINRYPYGRPGDYSNYNGGYGGGSNWNSGNTATMCRSGCDSMSAGSAKDSCYRGCDNMGSATMYGGGGASNWNSGNAAMMMGGMASNGSVDCVQGCQNMSASMCTNANGDMEVWCNAWKSGTCKDECTKRGMATGAGSNGFTSTSVSQGTVTTAANSVVNCKQGCDSWAGASAEQKVQCKNGCEGMTAPTYSNSMPAAMSPEQCIKRYCDTITNPTKEMLATCTNGCNNMGRMDAMQPMTSYQSDGEMCMKGCYTINDKDMQYQCIAGCKQMGTNGGTAPLPWVSGMQNETVEDCTAHCGSFGATAKALCISTCKFFRPSTTTRVQPTEQQASTSQEDYQQLLRDQQNDRSEMLEEMRKTWGNFETMKDIAKKQNAKEAQVEDTTQNTEQTKKESVAKVQPTTAESTDKAEPTPSEPPPQVLEQYLEKKFLKVDTSEKEQRDLLSDMIALRKRIDTMEQLDVLPPTAAKSAKEMKSWLTEQFDDAASRALTFSEVSTLKSQFADRAQQTNEEITAARRDVEKVGTPSAIDREVQQKTIQTIYKHAAHITANIPQAFGIFGREGVPVPPKAAAALKEAKSIIVAIADDCEHANQTCIDRLPSALDALADVKKIVDRVLDVYDKEGVAERVESILHLEE